MDTLLTWSIPIFPNINHLIPVKKDKYAVLKKKKKEAKQQFKSVKSITKGQNDQSRLKTNLNFTFRTKTEIPAVMKIGMGEDVWQKHSLRNNNETNVTCKKKKKKRTSINNKH